MSSEDDFLFARYPVLKYYDDIESKWQEEHSRWVKYKILKKVKDGFIVLVNENGGGSNVSFEILTIKKEKNKLTIIDTIDGIDIPSDKGYERYVSCMDQLTESYLKLVNGKKQFSIL